MFALDAQLGEIVRTTRTPIVGQMRLTWWHDALHALDAGPPPAHPVLRALAADVRPGGVNGATLATMIDGWERLLGDAAPDDDGLADYAECRGTTLFVALGVLSGGAGGEGRCWALADLASHVSDATLRQRAATLALAQPLGRGARVTRALARDARMAAAGMGAPGRPRRAAGVLAAVFRGAG